MLDSQIYTTDSVSERERRAFWRDLICDVYVELECEYPREGEFSGQIHFQSLADLELSRVRTDAQDVLRTKSRISRSSQQDFLISLQTAGFGIVEQDGREAHLRPGDFALYDTTRPYRLRFGERFEQLVVKLRRQDLKRRLPLPETLTALRVGGDRGIGRLASRLIQSTSKQLRAVDEPLHGALAENVMSLVASALGSVSPAAGAHQSSNRVAQLYRVKTFIEDHLHDAELTVETVAAAHGISPRYLHMLFKPESMTVSRWIWERRLERCRKDLANPQLAGMNITEIAFRWGFNDSAHFSRTFKQRFGHSPRDYRHQILPVH